MEQVYRASLAVWRKSGSIDGQACTNCHSSDGVELAIIGFPDDSSLRRAQQHLSAEDAFTVRDFVHAQRLRLRITEVCSTDWRPFRPGGQVLAGANPEQQDASFLKVLEARKLLVATSKVVTNEDAKRAFAELQGVDLRQLPSDIPLPRFSEDKFNGPGGFAIEPPCYDALNYPSWIQAFPASFRDEFPEEDLMRTLLLLSRELLQAGTPLQADQNYDHCLSVICQTEEMYGYVNDLKKFADDPTRSAALAAQGLDMAFYNTDTRKLLDEVVALMKAAPKRD